jgi:hypothetical protein
MTPAANESNFKQVVIFEQTKSLRNLKELSEKVDTAKKETKDTDAVKRVEKLSSNLENLADVIKEQTKVALKNGFGAETANNIQENNVGRVKEQEKSSGLRNYLIGNTKGGIIDKILTKREEKKALVKERQEFVKGAISNDPRSIALKNLKGEDYAKADAEKRFAEVKAKESDVTAAKARIDASKNAGYTPKKKDLETLDKQTKELAELDPRIKSQFKANAKEKLTKNIIPQGADESIQEAAKVKADSDNKIASLEGAELSNELVIGQTLKESLDVQKQMLDAIKENGAAGGNSLLESAADLAGDLGGKKVLKGGGKLLSRAGGMLKAAGSTAIGSAAITYAGAAAGGYAVDAGMGALGVGKDKEGKDLQIDENKDDTNWKKMSLGEKAQSGMARGVEKLGKLFFLDNLSREAQADRIKNESAYFDKKEADVKKEDSIASGIETDQPMHNADKTIMRLKGFDPDSPDEVKAFANLTRGNKDLNTIPNINSSFSAGRSFTYDQRGDKLIGNSRQNEDIKADGNKPAVSPTTIINSPTNISKSTTSMEYRSPIRNPESSVNRFFDSRYGT